jgi:predicted nuclease of restriction endonuclease-like (RecB) superfamily
VKKNQGSAIPADFASAVKDIKLAILQARAKAAHLANAEALKLYFFVGGYISKKTRNAKWGSGAIDALSNQLQVELPGLRGFSASSMIFMRLFYEAWAAYPEIRHLASDEFHYLPSNEIDNAQIHYLPSNEFADTNNRQMPSAEIRPLPTDELDKDDIAAFFSIGFTHHREIIRFCKDFDERLYYIHACAKAPWTVEQLQQHLRADDYHHIGALPNNFAKTLSPMALATKAVRSFRDEYLLELINLDNVDAIHDQDIDERVLSKELVANIEKTIAALGGSEFCFMGREKRLVVEGEELFVDLLFYHRTLQAMVAIELKMGKFRAAYLGQLSQYLSVLDAVEKKPNENPSVGLLLCEKMNKPVVQLTVQGYSQPIGIATYQALRNIPQPYKALAPVIDGVRKVMIEYKRETSADAGAKKRKASR